MKLLRLTASGERTYQKDLIHVLRQYSNKTVIEKLQKLVTSGVLEEGMEKRRVKGTKLGWVKWYELTFLGKWVSLLLLEPKEVSRKEAEKIMMELFTYYARNAIELCVEYNIDPSLLRKAFEEAFTTVQKYGRT